ncbi:AEC family transporter [Vibrio sp.]|nr:AEC family transporter [Vibrio sp.]
METFLQQFIFSTQVTGPICLMLFLGMLFKRIRLIDDHFIEVASRLVFKVTLPVLLFLSIIGSDHNFLKGSELVLFGIAANVVFFIVAWVVLKFIQPNNPDLDVIVQGAYRGNTAIVGLAYVANLYGNEGIAHAALFVAGQTLLFNIQAVILLSPKTEGVGLKALGTVFKSITKNPLIIAIIAGVIFSQLPISLPSIAMNAGQYFAHMTLPLALICAGGSLDLRAFGNDKTSVWLSTVMKLIACPIFITLAAYLYGFRNEELAIILLTSTTPAAAASYVMARGMGRNHVMAANIIVVTTILSLFTTTVGVFLLTKYQLI